MPPREVDVHRVMRGERTTEQCLSGLPYKGPHSLCVVQPTEICGRGATLRRGEASDPATTPLLQFHHNARLGAAHAVSRAIAPTSHMGEPFATLRTVAN